MEPVFEFPLDLDAGAAPGLMRRLHEHLRAAILDRRLRPGAPLPSTRRVAAAYGIARNTVIAAYDLLVAEGYVSARAGARMVVAELGAKPIRTSPRTAPVADERLNPHWRSQAAHPHAGPAGAWSPGFQLGTPDLRLVPFDIWRRLLARSVHPRNAAAFGYPEPAGQPQLRSAIAQHVAFARAVACAADDVLITAGAQQAFDLLARLLVTPGRTQVAVEDPGYPPLRNAMAAAGARLVPVPVDEEGLRVDRLPHDVRVVCTTPSHQFPTGAAMSMSRRLALLAFARRHGAVVIEDDYDGEFRYGQRPLDALQTLDREGCVFYVGTFSKSLFPSLRIGFAVVPAWAREPLTALKQCADTAGNAQVQDALARFILDGHLARHLRRMRKVYARRHEAMLDALDAELRVWFLPIPSEAGIHLAVRVRDEHAAKRILPIARRLLPGAQPIGDFATDEPVAGLALGFGGIEADAIRAALHTLATALAR